MKTTFTTIIALLIVSTSINAQFFSKKVKGNGDIVTENRNVSDYDNINVAGSFDVKLVKGTEGKLTIKADENLMEYIVTEVKDGSLKIKPEKGYNLRASKTILVTVPFKTIEGVSVAGSGDVFSDDTVQAETLKLSIAGSGDIKLTIDTQTVKSSIAGSGDIQLSGTTDTIKCSIAGSGDINGYELKAATVKASIAGSGNVKIHATDEIHGSSVGSGSIYYKGNPTVEKIKSIGSGAIVKKG